MAENEESGLSNIFMAVFICEKKLLSTRFPSSSFTKPYRCVSKTDSADFQESRILFSS